MGRAGGATFGRFRPRSSSRARGHGAAGHCARRATAGPGAASRSGTDAGAGARPGTAAIARQSLRLEALRRRPPRRLVGALPGKPFGLGAVLRHPARRFLGGQAPRQFFCLPALAFLREAPLGIARGLLPRQRLLALAQLGQARLLGFGAAARFQFPLLLPPLLQLRDSGALGRQLLGLLLREALGFLLPDPLLGREALLLLLLEGPAQVGLPRRFLPGEFLLACCGGIAFGRVACLFLALGRDARFFLLPALRLCGRFGLPPPALLGSSQPCGLFLAQALFLVHGEPGVVRHRVLLFRQGRLWRRGRLDDRQGARHGEGIVGCSARDQWRRNRGTPFRHDPARRLARGGPGRHGAGDLDRFRQWIEQAHAMNRRRRGFGQWRRRGRRQDWRRDWRRDGYGKGLGRRQGLRRGQGDPDRPARTGVETGHPELQRQQQAVQQYRDGNAGSESPVALDR